MNKKIILSLIILLTLLFVFILFANPFPKKKGEKTFKKKLDDATKIDLVINSPYDYSSYEIAKEITNKEEIQEYIKLIENIEITDDNYLNNDYNPDKFYYTIIINTEDEKDTLSIFFQDKNVNVNGKLATVDSDIINELDEKIKSNISGYGTLKCESITITNTIVEKYYFKNNKVYYYTISQTYIPEDINIIDNNILNINKYPGVNATGNTIGDKSYSYIIGIDLENISFENFQEITGLEKNTFINKNKDDFIIEKSNMNCSFTFR